MVWVVRMKSFVAKMRCSRCGAEYEPNSRLVRCPNRDDGRLDISYDIESIREVLTKDVLSRRQKGVWRFRELLPIDNPEHIVSLGEGGAPLVAAKRLANTIGVKSLWLLDDTRNPTGSFKDRPMTVGISKAVELGYRTVASASSGNAAAALSAYAAKAGLKCVTFVPEMASTGKLAQLSMYGARVVKIRGLETGQDPTVTMLKEVCDRYNWYPCPSFGSMNAYQAEGPKTMSYEIMEELDWNSPEWVFVPVGAGGALGGNWKGCLDLERLDFINSKPKMVAVQSSGCAPVIRAFEQKVKPLQIESWKKPDSVATGLMDPFPWDGDSALSAVRDSGGFALAVTDQEILDAQRLLAKTEGIFAEPSGVTSLAGLIRAINRVEKSDEIVVEITGNGLKDPAIAMRNMPEVPVIDPNVKELEKVLQL